MSYLLGTTSYPQRLRPAEVYRCADFLLMDSILSFCHVLLGFNSFGDFLGRSGLSDILGLVRLFLLHRLLRCHYYLERIYLSQRRDGETISHKCQSHKIAIKNRNSQSRTCKLCCSDATSNTHLLKGTVPPLSRVQLIL